MTQHHHLDGSDHDENAPRPIIAIGHSFPPSFELAEHRHRRSQFLYATNGVMAVSTPDGAWVAPPERAVWIPAGTPHSVRMVGAVQTRSVLIEPHVCGRADRSARWSACRRCCASCWSRRPVCPPTMTKAGATGW